MPLILKAAYYILALVSAAMFTGVLAELWIRHVNKQDKDSAYEVVGRVIRVILDYSMVEVRDSIGFSYLITRRSRGIDMDFLEEGMSVKMQVALRSKRVIEVDII